MRTRAILLGSLACLAFAGCSIAADPAPTGFGRLQLGLSVGALHPEITYAEVKIVAAGMTCAAPAVLNAAGDPAIIKAWRVEGQTLPVLPKELDAPERGLFSAHPFFDALFVLDPAKYHVCATPMTAKGPSEVCGLIEGNATVAAEATSEILLISQCKGDPSGGLDVIVTLNDPPYIEGVDVEPSKFVCAGKFVTVAVKATDPNGDPLKYYWSLDGKPLLPYPDGYKMKIAAPLIPGVHTVKIVVTDSFGAAASFSFPLHVNYCLFEPPKPPPCD